MSVGVITHQITMVEPYHISYMEEIPEQAVDVLAGERLVAVRRQQALRCSEERTLAVALYASAFEHEALVVLQCRIEGSLIVELQIDGIVLFPVEFLAPSVELEVEQMDRDDVRIVSAARNHADRSVVARPGIVGIHLVEVNAVHLSLRQLFGEHSLGAFQDRCHHQQVFVAGDDVCELQIRVGYLSQIRLPVRSAVWPREHDGALWFPFCGKCEIAR